MSAYHNKHYLSISTSMFMFFKQKISTSAEINLRQIVYNQNESKKNIARFDQKLLFEN